MVSCQDALPKTDDLGKNFIRWETDQKVDVIGHEDGKMAKPNLLLTVKANGIENGCPYDRVAKLVFLSWFSAEGDEIIGIWRDPVGRFVIETFARNHGFERHRR